MVALTLLNLSAAFDTIVHDIHEQRLHLIQPLDLTMAFFSGFGRISLVQQYIRRAKLSTAYLTSPVPQSPQRVYFGAGAVRFVNR